MTFSNAGCHLPHGMSYAVSGLVREFRAPDYPQHEPMVPHGMSVMLNAPSVYRFTASACPDRHLEGAQCLGADTRGATNADAGEVLAKHLIGMMQAHHAMMQSHHNARVGRERSNERDTFMDWRAAGIQPPG